MTLFTEVNWEQEHDKLAAQVERLREALSLVMREALGECYQTHDCDGVLTGAISVMEETPEQSLAEIEAAAIEAALKESTFLGPDGASTYL